MLCEDGIGRNGYHSGQPPSETARLAGGGKPRSSICRRSAELTEVLTKDLVALVADANIEAALQGLLRRCESLGIRNVSAEVFVHPERDPGCLRRPAQFLKPMAGRFGHALVVFDLEGCGSRGAAPTELETKVTEALNSTGWGGRAGAVVLCPELEAWVWSDSPEVDQVLGWSGRVPGLRSWLAERGFLAEGQVKPDRPKEAVELALREVRRPRSSRYYRELAEKVSVRRCQDAAFGRFLRILQEWFPPHGE